MRPTNLCNQRYHFCQQDQEELQEVTKACSILLAWANITEWNPAAGMHPYFTAMDDIIPRRLSKMSLSLADAKALPAVLRSQSGRRSADLARWWENRNNKAMAAKFHFPLEKFIGVSVA